MSTNFEKPAPAEQNYSPPQPQQVYVQQPAQQPQQIYVQQSPKPQQVYVQQPAQPQQVYVQQPIQSNQMQLLQVQDIRSSPQQQQPTIQIPQQNNLMFQNQINQMPLIGLDQQPATIEESLTFSIKWNCSVIIKFLLDFLIFDNLLTYQYGLINFVLPYSLITIVYEDILQYFHIIMCAVFIWANLGCGYSYRNSPTFKRFHYIMLGLYIYSVIKCIVLIYFIDELQSRPSYIYYISEYGMGYTIAGKIIMTILLAISICYKK